MSNRSKNLSIPANFFVSCKRNIALSQTNGVCMGTVEWYVSEDYDDESVILHWELYYSNGNMVINNTKHCDMLDASEYLDECFFESFY